jgi:hypothetical protein
VESGHGDQRANHVSHISRLVPKATE